MTMGKAAAFSPEKATRGELVKWAKSVQKLALKADCSKDNYDCWCSEISEFLAHQKSADF